MLIHANKGFRNQKFPRVAETNKKLCCVYSYVCKRILIVKASDAKTFLGLCSLLRCFRYSLPPSLYPVEKILLSLGKGESCGGKWHHLQTRMFFKYLNWFSFIATGGRYCLLLLISDVLADL